MPSPAPATLSAAAGFPLPAVSATKAGSVTASTAQAAGVAASVTDTAVVTASVS